MSLRISDSRAGRKIPFEPLEAGVVRMYHCGPTVKEPANINRFRSYLLADLLHRYFDAKGLRVHQVMNLTDIGHLNEFEEDVIEIAASREGLDPGELTAAEIEEFHAERRELRIRDAERYPRAGEHIDAMVEFVQALVDRGAAYRTDRNVYLDITSVQDFGALSGKNLQELTRLQDNLALTGPDDKRHPLDIDLWRTDSLHQIHWPSPWGKGFPGWHLECVVMSQKYLGMPFDIHTGPEELRFPHHECEIAQAAACGHETLARYWLHSAHVLLDGRCISRENQNRLTIKALLNEGYRGAALRCVLLGTHYRTPIELEPRLVDEAEETVDRWQKAAAAIREQASQSNADNEAHLREAEQAFDAALDDDLDYPRALSVAIELAEQYASGARQPSREVTETLERFDRVLALL